MFRVFKGRMIAKVFSYLKDPISLLFPRHFSFLPSFGYVLMLLGLMEQSPFHPVFQVILFFLEHERDLPLPFLPNVFSVN